MKQKVWIFGDSYAARYDEGKDLENSWPYMIAKKYNVINEALPGSSIFLALKKINNLINHNTNTQDDILIFYMSNRDRIDFSFLERDEDACMMHNVVNDNSDQKWIKKYLRRYKRYSTFIKNFYQYYVFNNEKALEMSMLGHYVLLKELSKRFKKVLVVPVFQLPYIKDFTIDDTEKFSIAKGNALWFHDEKNIDTDQVNHMRVENHKIIYDMTVDWIENDIPFDTEKLKKIS